MKIKVGNLRSIIRETLNSVIQDDEAPVTDDEFDEIIVSETIEKSMQENSFSEWLDISVAAFIGLAGVGITIGRAASIAKQLYHEIDDFRKDEVEAATNALPEHVVEKVQEISDDPKLAQMYDELGNMRGVATAEEVRMKSKQIKNYMKLSLTKNNFYADEVRLSQQKRAY